LLIGFFIFSMSSAYSSLILRLVLLTNQNTIVEFSLLFGFNFQISNPFVSYIRDPVTSDFPLFFFKVAISTDLYTYTPTPTHTHTHTHTHT